MKNAEEFYREGKYLSNGDGEALLMAEASFREAAEQGHVAAQYELAMMCLGVGKRAVLNAQGNVCPGLERDVYVEEGVGWLVKAAKGGSVAAQRELGLIYCGREDRIPGLRKMIQPQDARKWLSLAAAHGDVVSSELLHEMGQ